VSVALRAASEGGLPPRARGRHESESHAKDLARTTPACAGTTPACAGTTSPCPSPRLQSRDYPRVRGDDFALHLKCASRTGLPPRARGRLFDLGPDDTPDRTTPACAGTTCPPSQSGACTWDYPRVRGDDATPSRGCMGRAG